MTTLMNYLHDVANMFNNKQEFIIFTGTLIIYLLYFIESSAAHKLSDRRAAIGKQDCVKEKYNIQSSKNHCSK